MRYNVCMMTKPRQAAYERITYLPEGITRAQVIILRNPRNVKMFGAACISGISVNAEGDEISPRGSDEAIHIIDTSLIRKRTPLAWSLHYGTLEAIR